MPKTLYPNSIRIGLMDPSIAQTWAQRILSDGTTVGSIKKGDTINHTTSQPIATGLFCQRIFGPCIDYTCACGHEKIRIGFNPNIAPPVCSECHVEWTHASVRRQFLGSIDLISPVTHKWFSDSRGAYIPTLLGITPRTFRNLKECKLFFPFGLKNGQELIEYSKEKKTKENNTVNLVPLCMLKKAPGPFRAMHSLQFLLNPQKSLAPSFLQNVQLVKNLRDFWFLCDSGQNFNTILSEKTLFNSLKPSFLKETSFQYSNPNTIFGKKRAFQNSKNFSTTVFLNLQNKTEKKFAAKECCAKDQNFFSLITTAQWLISEHASLVKEKELELFSQKTKTPIKSVFSSKQKLSNKFNTYQPNTKNSLKLEFLSEQQKDQAFSIGVEQDLLSPREEKSLESSLIIKPALQSVPLKRKPQSFKTQNRLKNLSFNTPDRLLDWKAKALLREKNLNSKAITDLAALFNPKSDKKKENLKYIFLLAQKMKIENLSVFSKGFSLLALENKPVSIKTFSEVTMRGTEKDKKEFLGRFFEDIKKLKQQGKTEVLKLESNPFFLVGKNATYLFRNFTKYQFLEIPELLFGKNEKTTQLFLKFSTPKIQFGSKIKHFNTINKYKIGRLRNSKIGLFMHLSPFSVDFLRPHKNLGNLAQTVSKSFDNQSTTNWLVNKNQEKKISYRNCENLLRITGTKLWYLEPQKTFAHLILKTRFYEFKAIKHYTEENSVDIELEKKSLNLKAFNFEIFDPNSNSLRNLLSNKLLNKSQREKLSSHKFSVHSFGGFTKNHNYPIRPSYTQPEDFRRQFIKFLGTNALIQKKDIPILRYNETIELINKVDIEKSRVKQPFTQKYKDNFVSPQAIEIYFSEAKSIAKEQTIKKILSQTGGGGLQAFLELVNLSELVLILQNDLWEITPRLAKSQFTRRVLLSIINDASNSLADILFLLRKSMSTKTPYDAKGTLEPGSNSSPLFTKKQEKTLHGPFSINFENLQNKENTISPTRSILVEKNNLLLSEKVEVLEKKCKDVKKEYKAVKKICSDFQNRKNVHKRRYKLAFQLLRTMSNPAGMTMSSVPVLPPGLRPIIDVPKIGPITADLNIRYRSLLFALRNLRELAYVDFRNAGAAQASVQEAVDDLLYTGGKSRREKTSSQNPNLYKSLAMRLKGKHGRFRGNLLGKRVDYSGRSVIVVGPTLKIHQCGLPFEIAIKLFNPFLIRSLIQRGFCKNIYKAKQILLRGKFKPLIWTLCQEVMSEHLVLLNRAPTLHRLGVQAFMPILISGRAILLHPLVCTGFNADFDGDQMGVHVPLFPQARAEAWKMMWSRNNFLLPSSGEPVLLPSQDMVLGCYYLTSLTQKVVQTTLETLTSNDQISFPFTVLNKKTALTRYKKGTYNIQSSVWINHYKTRVLTPGKLYERYQKKSVFSNPRIYQNQRVEDEGIVTPTLELRITPFGIMRLLSTSSLKSFTFQNSLLLPGRQQTLKPPVFAIFTRTTIGRLLFNNLLKDLNSF